MTDFATRCSGFARRLTRQAVAIALLALLPLTGAIAAIAMTATARPLLATSLILISLAAAVGSFALSALLCFDAALFRLMSHHTDETSGGRAVDEFLARTKLKPLPPTTRPLSSRVAGAKRLMRRQIMVAAIAASFAILALAANFA